MKARYFLPSRVQCPEELGADEKARLERTILEALRRGIAAAAGEMPEILVADPELPQDAREFFSPSRYRADRDTYAVPSYQQGGAQIDTPVESMSSEEEAGEGRTIARLSPEDSAVQRHSLEAEIHSLESQRRDYDTRRNSDRHGKE